MYSKFYEYIHFIFYFTIAAGGLPGGLSPPSMFVAFASCETRVSPMLLFIYKIYIQQRAGAAAHGTLLTYTIGIQSRRSLALLGGLSTAAMFWKRRGERRRRAPI